MDNMCHQVMKVTTMSPKRAFRYGWVQVWMSPGMDAVGHRAVARENLRSAVTRILPKACGSQNRYCCLQCEEAAPLAAGKKNELFCTAQASYAKAAWNHFTVKTLKQTNRKLLGNQKKIFKNYSTTREIRIYIKGTFQKAWIKYEVL